MSIYKNKFKLLNYNNKHYYNVKTLPVLRPIRFNYGEKFQKRQLVKQNFGLSEKKFRHYLKNNVNSKSLVLLESRLDRVLFRMGLVPTLPSAKQLISHGKIKLNGSVVRSPGILLNTLDIISVTKPGKRLIKDWVSFIMQNQNGLRENFVVFGNNNSNKTFTQTDLSVFNSYFSISNNNKTLKSLVKYDKMTWLYKEKVINPSWRLRGSYSRILFSIQNSSHYVPISFYINKQTVLKGARTKSLSIPSYVKVNYLSLCGIFIKPHLSDLNNVNKLFFNSSYTHNSKGSDIIYPGVNVYKESHFYKYF